jgi:photosystem II stability/assembly factor-like uncharacterized protein
MPRRASTRRLAVTLAALLAPLAPAAANAYNAVDSPDGIYVLAVGDSGRMARSWNGGSFWSPDTLGTAHLNGLVMRGDLALMAASDGRVWRSTDAGGTWSGQMPAGPGTLYTLDLTPGASTGIAAGAGGRLLRTSDAGLTWQTATSGTGRTLRAARVTGSAAWVVGDSGTVLRSIDAGASWAPVAIGTGADLLAVDAAGGTIWITGRSGTAFRSTNGGAAWTRVPLGLGAGIDVTIVRLAAPDTVWLAGGGGFVRRSVDAGATWTFARQPAFGAIGDLHFASGHPSGWAALRNQAGVLTTADGGLTWTLPVGTVDASKWLNVRPYGETVRGNTIAPNGLQPRGLFAAIADSLFRSGDRGVTWSAFAELPATNKTNAFFVSPRDTMRMVAAVGEPDRIVRSLDGGASWVTTLTRDFSEFGTPLEMDVVRPESLLFAPENGVLYRSTDFGATWDSVSAPGFRSPCDIQTSPDDSLNIWVGDGITSSGFGQIFQSTDGGLTFTLRFVSGEGSEIPALALAPLEPRLGIGTQWSRGGVVRTLDGGATWQTVSTAQTAWGASFAPDDPTAVAFGLFASGLSYLSSNRAANFTAYPLPSSNYAIHSMDRATWLATQSSGLHRFAPSYTLPFVDISFLTLESPNGGESWKGGETREIRWDAFNLFRVVIEYSPDYSTDWIPIDTVAAYTERYMWRIPAVIGSSARVRIRNAWGPQPVDESNGPFTLASSFLTLTPGILDMGSVAPGQEVVRHVTIGNPGNIPLEILNVAPPVTTGPAEFFVSRTSFTIPAAGSDTLGIRYRPNDVGRDTATIVITTNGAESPHALLVTGESLPSAFSVSPIAPNPVRTQSLIRYALPVAADVRLEVYNLTGQRVATLVDARQQPGEYAVPFGPGAAMGGGAGRAALPAGVYFYRFRAGPLDVQKKIVLLR